MVCCHKDITTIKGFLSPTIRSWGKFTAVQFWRQMTTTIVCNFVTFLATTCSKVSLTESSQIKTKFNYPATFNCRMCQLSFHSSFIMITHLKFFITFSLAAIFLRQKQIFSRESQRFLSNNISLWSAVLRPNQNMNKWLWIFEGTRRKENSFLEFCISELFKPEESQGTSHQVRVGDLTT